MALNGLTFDGRIYRWGKSFSDLKSFVEDSLDLRGKWSSPGGDVKLFNSDEDSAFVIKWYGAKSGKLAIQKDNDEEYIKQKFESLVSVCQSSSKILSEAEDGLSRVSGVYDCVDGPVVAEVEGLKSNIISLESRIDSVLMPEISSLRAKQKDLETLIRKQDELISELKEDNLFFKSKLLSLSSFCFEKSMSKVIQNDFEYNDSALAGIINVPDESISIVNDQSPVSNVNAVVSVNKVTSPVNKNVAYSLEESLVKDKRAVLNPNEGINESRKERGIDLLSDESNHRCATTKSRSQNNIGNAINENNKVSTVDGNIDSILELTSSHQHSTTNNITNFNARKLNKVRKSHLKSDESNNSASKESGLNWPQFPFDHALDNNNLRNRGDVNIHRPVFKYPKHQTPCPFLRKRGFCKKGSFCDFLHKNPNTTQQPFHNPIEHVPFPYTPRSNFYQLPFPMDPYYHPPVRSPAYHPIPQLYPYLPPLMSIPTLPPQRKV